MEYSDFPQIKTLKTKLYRLNLDHKPSNIRIYTLNNHETYCLIVDHAKYIIDTHVFH